MRDAFIVNEDNSHFFGSRSPNDMTLEGLHAFVDQYAESAVTHLFLCPNAMRASFRATTRDAIWDAGEGMVTPTGGRAKWPDNAKLLHERGLDPYAVWIARSRTKGLSPWLSMRMNDIHSVGEPEDFMHSTFWRHHPECWRVPNGSAAPWQNRAMNYAHPEVREHQMAFVRELLERYDPDGLELDWMRFGYHLSPGKEREEAHILTDFVRDVRQLTERWSTTRGHRIALGVRVPAHPDAAAGLGMDGVTWAREGLVDMLVPCPFWSSSDFDIPVELWRERLGAASPVVIAPGLEFNARPWPGGKPVANDLGTLYGFAESARFRGADSFYLFNFMDSGTRPVPASAYRTIVEKGVDAGTTRAAVRRFPVCYRDTVPAGFPNGSCLPVKGRRGGTFRIPIGHPPTEGSGHMVLGLAAAEGIGETALAVTLNGTELSAAPDLKTCAGLGGGSARAIRAAIPLKLLRDGHNDVVVKQTDDGPEASIVWAELRLTP